MPDYDEVLRSIRRITRAIDLQSKKLFKKTGLTAPQLIILKNLQREGSAKPSDIARDVLLSQATVTSIVDRLEIAGLVSRVRDHEDRRIISVVLTTQGREKIDHAPELLQEGFLREFRKLADWERSQLVASLQHIAAMMDAEDIDAAPILNLGDMHVESSQMSHAEDTSQQG